MCIIDWKLIGPILTPFPFPKSTTTSRPRNPASKKPEHNARRRDLPMRSNLHYFSEAVVLLEWDRIMSQTKGHSFSATALSLTLSYSVHFTYLTTTQSIGAAVGQVVVYIVVMGFVVGVSHKTY
ncbi:hypothetical protein DdX_12226 [Ditylenchus destructor]|uniref:Uncharacterized protein n=1 Tax=Ditylenchus destructor TaxID=166010 RepID=A0AAD4MUQ2_9BILA|nr:hypothetical protein DdX_12226 [Ditylenchus destructor]